MAKKSGKNEPFVVQSKVRSFIKSLKMKCASDVMDQLNHIVTWHIEKGCNRAKANGRRTVRATDF